jgi:hypothetical protein
MALTLPGHLKPSTCNSATSPKTGVYYRRRDIDGVTGTLPDLIQELAKLRRSEVIRRLVVLMRWVDAQGGMTLQKQLCLQPWHGQGCQFWPLLVPEKPTEGLRGGDGRATTAGLRASRSRAFAVFHDSVGCSQKGCHFGRPVGTTVPENILVGPNALHLMLRAFGSTRMCHGYGTSGAFQIARVVPNEVAADTRRSRPFSEPPTKLPYLKR